jgi:TonB family protein
MQTTFLPYLLQASGCLAVLYLLYRLLLHRETFFAFNRWYLLGSVVVAAGLPLVELPAPATPLYAMPAISLDAITLLPEGENARRLDWTGLLVKLYAAGAVFFAARLGYRLHRLRRLARQLPGEPRPGYRLLLTGGRMPTFSFFGWLFWDETATLSETEKVQVLRHEEAHIRQRHSADVLLLEIAAIFLWFNPFVHLLGKEIRAVHEYLADREALRTGDAQTYLRLVAGQALQALRIPLIQPFHAPGFRHRIRMIRTGYAGRPAAWKATVCLLVAGMLSVLYACGTDELIDPLASNSVDPAGRMPLVKPLKGIGSDEQMPQPSREFTNYIAKHIRYPLSARQDGLEGTVMTRFVVRKDGSIANVEITQSLRQDLDDEVLRTLRESTALWKPAMQDGKPVDVQVQFPFRFHMDNGSALPRQDGGILVVGYGPGVPPPPPPADDNVFAVVEEMPEFPGGMEGLIKYLSENLRYPAEAREMNVQGTVFLGFVVQADGAITDVGVLKGIGKGCDDEARRVLSGMPPWQPGKQGGKAVAVRYSLPIRFVMD